IWSARRSDRRSGRSKRRPSHTDGCLRSRSARGPSCQGPPFQISASKRSHTFFDNSATEDGLLDQRVGAPPFFEQKSVCRLARGALQDGQQLSCSQSGRVHECVYLQKVTVHIE